MFDLLMNGVGDAFSTIHWGTHFLLRKDDFVLAVDCPDSYRRALSESAFEHRGDTLDAHHIDAMILTHLHGDHVNGLEMLACYLRFAFQKKLVLYTNPDAYKDLWARLRPSLEVLWDGQTFHKQKLEDFLDVRVVDWGQPFQVGPFEITSRATMHHLPAMAMRISDGDAALGYSCDTAWDPELIDWLTPTDFIIHESSMGPAHTPMEKLAGLPEEVRQKMIIAHYPDALVGSEPSGLELAEQGRVYEISSR